MPDGDRSEVTEPPPAMPGRSAALLLTAAWPGSALYARWLGLGVSVALLLTLLALAGILRALVFTLSPGQIGTMRARSEISGQLLAYMHEEPGRLLATLMLVQAAALSALCVAATLTAAVLEGPAGVAVPLAIIGAGALVGWGLAPFWATRAGYRLLHRYAFWLMAAFEVLAPLSRALARIAPALESLLTSPPAGMTTRGDGATTPSAADMPPAPQSQADTARAQPTSGERDLLKAVARFNGIPVRQVMTPRLDMITIDLEDDYHQLMDLINKSGKSRLPVTEGYSLDTIKGIIYTKDLLAHTAEGEAFDWRGLIRPPLSVPAGRMIDQVMHQFQTGKVHLAIVVDEFGGTDGLITLEDILEEIVGEIRDESDQEAQTWTQTEDGEWLAQGRTPLNEILRATGTDPDLVEEARGEAETIAGLLLEQLGRMPKTGDEISVGPLVLTVLAAGARQVRRVRIRVEETEEGTGM